MKRLTLERVNGIKTGYWSPAKKDELIDRLAQYEDLGLEPEQIKYILDCLCVDVFLQQMEKEKKEAQQA